MHYLTRHLEALTDFSHGNQYLTAGAPFSATEVDADYLIQKKKARDVAAPDPAAFSVPMVAAPVSAPAPVAASAPIDSAAAQVAAPLALDETASVTAADPTTAAPVTRRPGRASNAERAAAAAQDTKPATDATGENGNA